MTGIQPTDHGFRPQALGARFQELAIEKLVGAPAVEFYWGGPDLTRDGREVAFSWNRTGNNEIFAAPLVGERIYQLTDGTERSVWPRWSPDGSRLAFLRDTGGNERFAIWIMNRDGKRQRDITNLPDIGHRDIAWSPDGRSIAFASNSGGGYGVEIISVDSGERRALTDGAGDAAGPSWSPDGRWIVFGDRRDTIRTNADLYLIAVDGGEAIRLDTRGGLAGESFGAHWSPKGDMLAFTTNIRGQREVALAHLADGSVTRIEHLTATPHDSTAAGWRLDGRGVFYLQNAEGEQSVRRIFTVSHADVPVMDLPGVNRRVSSGPDSETVVTTFSTARRPADIWVRSPDLVAPHPITNSLGDLDPRVLVEPTHVRYASKDGRQIPALLYIPHAEAVRGNGLPPAIVHIHGGPIGQHMRDWDATSQWFAHRGYVVLAPNIRGSTGYGREFQESNRGDWGGRDLEDVMAGLNFLEHREIADGGRIGSYGGSYGGFMTLMALAQEPDRWAAGVSVVGVVSWETLVGTTRGDLRAMLTREFGDPTQSPDLFHDRSPLTHASKITAPVLVLQGENDPRVPRSEADQLVAALREQGTVHDYHVYPGEGHGFRRAENRIDSLRRAGEWFDKHLRA